MKKTIVIVLAFLAAVTVAGTSAYYIQAGQAANGFRIGEVITEISEEFDPPDEVDPGDVITKKVSIKNTGKNACFVRTQILFSDSDMENICALDYNTADWEYLEKNGEGWWYYKSVLDAGESTGPLFTQVAVSSTVEAEQIVPFEIYVRQESRQSYDATAGSEYGTWQDAWA